MRLPLEILKPLSSDVDWCEPNYAISVYITEFWNTISSIPLAVVPLYLMYLYEDYGKEISCTKYIYAAWISFFIVGLGSILFHGTLSLFGQFLDEISIIWVFCFFMILWYPNSCLPLAFGKNRFIFEYGILCLTILTTAVSVVRPEANHIALMIYTIPLFQAIYHVHDKIICPLHRGVYRKAALTCILALLCWFLDKFVCRLWLFFNFPYLHGFWHILAMFGLANTAACFSCFYAKREVPHKNPTLKFNTFFSSANWLGVWYVAFLDKNK